jgi:hypothetical protein
MQSPFFSWALPIWDVPGITWEEPYEVVCANDRLAWVISHHDAVAALDVAGGENIVSMPEVKFDASTFARFLSKIAHSFAVASLGEGTFNPVLLDFIRKGGNKPRVFVGGELEITPAEPFAYDIRLGIIEQVNGARYLSARIRLFSYLGTPTYVVVVGDHFEKELSSIEHGGYAKPAKFTVRTTEGVLAR